MQFAMVHSYSLSIVIFICYQFVFVRFSGALFVDGEGHVWPTTPVAGDCFWELYLQYARNRGAPDLQAALLQQLQILADPGHQGRGAAFEAYFLLKVSLEQVMFHHCDLAGENEESFSINALQRRMISVNKPPRNWKDIPSNTIVYHPGQGEQRLDFIYYNSRTVYFFVLTVGNYRGDKIPLLKDEVTEGRALKICKKIRKWIGAQYDVHVDGGEVVVNVKRAIRSRVLPPVVKYIIVSTCSNPLPMTPERLQKYSFIRVATLRELGEQKTNLLNQHQVQSIANAQSKSAP
jgi:hypothetical protein